MDAGLAIAARSVRADVHRRAGPAHQRRRDRRGVARAPRVAWSRGDLALVGVGSRASCAAPARRDRICAARAQVETARGHRRRARPLAALGTRRWPRYRRRGVRAGRRRTARRGPGSATRGSRCRGGRRPRRRARPPGARGRRSRGEQATRWRERARPSSRRDRGGFAARPQPAMFKLHRATRPSGASRSKAITDAIARGKCSKIVAARTCSSRSRARCAPATCSPRWITPRRLRARAGAAAERRHAGRRHAGAAGAPRRRSRCGSTPSPAPAASP